MLAKISKKAKRAFAAVAAVVGMAVPATGAAETRNFASADASITATLNVTSTDPNFRLEYQPETAMFIDNYPTNYAPDTVVMSDTFNPFARQGGILESSNIGYLRTNFFPTNSVDLVNRAQITGATSSQPIKVNLLTQDAYGDNNVSENMLSPGVILDGQYNGLGYFSAILGSGKSVTIAANVSVILGQNASGMSQAGFAILSLYQGDLSISSFGLTNSQIGVQQDNRTLSLNIENLTGQDQFVDISFSGGTRSLILDYAYNPNVDFLQLPNSLIAPSVPEPSTGGMLAAGLAVLAWGAASAKSKKHKAVPKLDYAA